ncbi:heavy metal-binding protein HIP-like [Mya arenaria]|uniref:heavy metal-binding protein HIP-like n=1 Tax=Mya arenaria TaxID=6604 RepID=UPI0022E6F347|nr:heavy metal-binding protein HIP-like [Mya arenaria]
MEIDEGVLKDLFERLEAKDSIIADLIERVKGLAETNAERLDEKDSIIEELVERVGRLEETNAKRLDGKHSILEERIEGLEETRAKQTVINEDSAQGRQELTDSVLQKDYQNFADTQPKPDKHGGQNQTPKETDKSYGKHMEDTSGIGSKDTHVPIDDSVIYRHRRHANTRAVAFFATLTNDVQHLGVNQNIVFNNAITNVGGAYNAHQGAFIAPVKGIYVFSATLLASNHDDDHLKWVRNGQTLCFIYVHSAGYDSSGSSVVVELDVGDDISIQNRDTNNSLAGSHYTFFSGFLLKETEADELVG